MDPFEFDRLDYRDQSQMIAYSYLRESEEQHIIRTIMTGYFEALATMFGGGK